MIHVNDVNFGDIEEFKYSTIKNNKGITYINIESAFDIETTSVIYQENKAAFMYVWQFGLGKDSPVIYGRTWEEFTNFINRVSDSLNLNSKTRLVIYVHNLGYEFQFMRELFEWNSVFAINERKPVKCLTTGGIEFRDSYILSGYSLANTAKNLTTYKIEKLTGDLDYSKVRHEETELTDEELKYCENDILVILYYIREQIEQYGDINKIPLTNTGRVRTFVKNNCYFTSKSHKKSSKGKFKRYSSIMRDLTLDKQTYIQLKRAFMGGFTHSNPLLTNDVLTNVDSVDLTSSYPTVMLSDKFPMSRPRPLKITTLKELKESFKKYCVLFDVKFTGLKNKIGYESYLSESKCYNKVKPVITNGRIYEADELITSITDVDFSIIEQVYSWDSISISNVQGFVKNYLPKPIIESILELYEKKTTLKDVDGYEVEYLLSKGMLNSVYGMCVTDFVKDEHTFTDDWICNPASIDEKIEDYNKSKNRFLYYPWGIWVTAYARRNLWMLILNVGDDYIYSDTDSVKMLNYNNHTKFINYYNDWVTTKLETMMKSYNLEVSRLTPETVKGVKKPLGVWDYEGHYTKFKTLGAKRYLIEENNKYHLTVAGLSKKNGMDYMIEQCEGDSEKIFSMFNDDLHIPSSNTGKMTHTYIDTEYDLMITDCSGKQKHVNVKSGIHLGNCDFTLSITKQYTQFINMLKSGYTYKGMKNV